MITLVDLLLIVAMFVGIMMALAIVFFPLHFVVFVRKHLQSAG